MVPTPVPVEPDDPTPEVDGPDDPTPEVDDPAEPTPVAVVPDATQAPTGAEPAGDEDDSSGICLGALALPMLIGTVAMVAAGRKSGYTERI